MAGRMPMTGPRRATRRTRRRPRPQRPGARGTGTSLARYALAADAGLQDGRSGHLSGDGPTFPRPETFAAEEATDDPRNRWPPCRGSSMSATSRRAGRRCSRGNGRGMRRSGQGFRPSRRSRLSRAIYRSPARPRASMSTGRGEGVASPRFASRPWNPSIPSSRRRSRSTSPSPAACRQSLRPISTSTSRPDEIVNGQIDLGALTAEFLALGLDPYPRKPGVDFSYQDPADEKDSPFAASRQAEGGE